MACGAELRDQDSTHSADESYVTNRNDARILSCSQSSTAVTALVGEDFQATSSVRWKVLGQIRKRSCPLRATAHGT